MVTLSVPCKAEKPYAELQGYNSSARSISLAVSTLAHDVEAAL